MYLKSRLILVSLSCTLIVLSAVVVFTGLYKGRLGGSVAEGCHVEKTSLLQIAIKTATFWEVVLVYDVIIFILLVRKAFQAREEISYQWGRHSTRLPSLLTILVRDGTIYFV
ncbi:hypothetical protein K435DRAFT_809093 [Dendrothele bispora CBS 962.96]|uniref:Uncharacterized protein n=1 Tax=Dendrothele bispora (strain CBS 962.96) TaxID=1314807 RepID=A0A4S8KZB4_DENBC|nr:hypothetical protein K435DRAFT_809093 [Dendrothele bispora CBS 962.96]